MSLEALVHARTFYSLLQEFEGSLLLHTVLLRSEI